MPTIVGILKFISMINTIPERLKARNFFINVVVVILVFMSSWNFMLSGVEHEKFYNLRARPDIMSVQTVCKDYHVADNNNLHH